MTEHVPTANREIVPLEIEHTSGVPDVNVTGNPEDAVAVTLNDPKLIDRAVIGLKVITCVGLVIVKLRFTATAAA